MELMKKNKLMLSGKSIMKVFTPGLLQEALDVGLELQEAIKLLEDIGAMVHKSEVNNLITSLGLRLAGDVLIDEEATGLTYHAIGTSSTAPASGDTTLNTEVARKQITTRDRTGAVLTLSTYYTSLEAPYDIRECGVFGSSTASASADSGILFSHYLQSYDNAGGVYDITFEYQVTVAYSA